MNFVAAGSQPMTFTTTGGERMRITSGGEVLINMTTTTTSGGGTMLSQGGSFANLRLFGTGSHTFSQFLLSGTVIGTITGSGSVTSYNVTSDYRLKEDLKEIKGLEKVSAIKVYDFKWKNEESRMDGVIAHELAEVLPYAVSGEKDGKETQSLNYNGLIGILTKEIQVLKKKVADQEAKALEQEAKALEQDQRIQALEKMVFDLINK